MNEEKEWKLKLSNDPSECELIMPSGEMLKGVVKAKVVVDASHFEREPLLEVTLAPHALNVCVPDERVRWRWDTKLLEYLPVEQIEELRDFLNAELRSRKER